MMRMEQGVKALLAASQIAIGNANNIIIRVYGEKGSLKWVQEDPNKLFFNTSHNPEQIIYIGGDYPYLSQRAQWNIRTPGGHPANMYP